MQSRIGLRALLLWLVLGTVAAAAADERVSRGAGELAVGRTLYMEGTHPDGAPLLARGHGGMLGEAFHQVFGEKHDLKCTDIDVNDDSHVLWAIATHFQPAKDLIIVDGLPGSPLDPSSSMVGTTSRMALDATRGPDFEGSRIRLTPRAVARAEELLRVHP